MQGSYLSDRVNNLKPSGIRKFFDIASTMQGVISLGIGEPDFTTPEAIIEAGVRSLRQGHTHYTSNAGIIELREKLSAHLNRMYGIHYQPDGEIIITVGGSEALYLTATALLNPGDEVIIPTPCFVSYQAEVILAGAVPVEIPCHMENNFEVDPAEVEAAITSRTKAILIGFPNNPTGAVASRETLEEIAMQNGEFFREAGGETLSYIPCLNDAAAHAGVMADLVQRHIQGWPEPDDA